MEIEFSIIEYLTNEGIKLSMNGGLGYVVDGHGINHFTILINPSQAIIVLRPHRSNDSKTIIDLNDPDSLPQLVRIIKKRLAEFDQ